MKICPTCQHPYSDDMAFCPRDGARLVAQATETAALLTPGLSRRFRIVRRLGAGGMGTVFLADQIGDADLPPSRAGQAGRRDVHPIVSITHHFTLE